MAIQTVDDNQGTDNFYKFRFYLLLFIIVFAVIFRASNRPLPLLFLELLSVSLILALFFSSARKDMFSGGLNKAVWLLLFFPLLYLVPLPWEIWKQLPGRELYADTLTMIDIGTMQALSIYPLKTEMALLALLPPVAVFFTVSRLDVNQLKLAVYVLIGVAFFQAVLGLVQYGDGANSSLRFGNTFAFHGAEGTYANRNHLAGLLEMVLPIVLGLLALSIGHTRSELRYHSNWRSRMSAFSGFHMNKSVVFGFIAVIILLGLIFTQSRTGVALAMLGILISTVAYAKRLGGTNVFGVIGTFTAVVVALAAEIGLLPLLQRFAVDHLSNLRFIIYENTLKGVGTFFPVGSGPGTYPYIYPRFQSIDEKGFINHAHNDYLEWLMEGGMLAGVFILLFLWFYIRRWPHVWTGGYWHTFRFIQVGAGIGILLMLLHGFTDFNFHIPANAVYFAFLAAVFFYRYQGEEDREVEVSKRGTSATGNTDMRTSKQQHLENREQDRQPVSEQETAVKSDSPKDVPNPFSEDNNDKEA